MQMIIRIIRFSILGGFCLWGIPASLAGQETYPYLAEITAQDVNVRAGQSSNFETLCQLDKGEVVIVFGKSYSWYKIRLPEKAESYVSAQYVERQGKDQGQIIADRVNIRAGPGIHFSILGQLQSGDQVHILSTVDGWLKITPMDKTYGWISEGYLVFKSSLFSSREPRLISSSVGHQTSFPELKKSSEKPPLEKETDAALLGPVISAKGQLHLVEEELSEGISHQLVMGGQTIYYIKGAKTLLNEFLHDTVEIQGRIHTHLPLTFPVLEIQRIQLIL